MLKNILIISMLLSSFTIHAQDKDANKTLTWGISTGDASAQIGSHPTKTENSENKVSLIYENQTVLEKPATVSYFFYNNKLVAKVITFTNSSVSDLQKIKEAISTLYGEPLEDSGENGAWQKDDTIITLGVKEDNKLVFVNYASLEALEKVNDDGNRRENRRDRRNDRRSDRHERRMNY